MEAMHAIIDIIWKMLCIPFPISNSISFNLWQYFGFIIVLAVIINSIFGKKGGETK